MNIVPLYLGIGSISVKGLKKPGVSCLTKNYKVRCAVSIHGSNQSAKQTATIDKNGGTDPLFSFYGQFLTINPKDEPVARQSVVIKLKENRFLCGKNIGQAHVPIEELLKNCVNEKGENQVSCVLVTPSGKVKGIVDIKYVVRELASYTGPGDGDPTAPESGGGDPPAAAAQPRDSSKFANVAAAIGAGFAAINACVGVFANCGGINF